MHSGVVWRRQAARGIGGELGQGIERQVDLQSAALHAQLGDRLAKLLVEMVWRHEVEKRHLGIRVGDHDRRGNLVSVVEDHPGRPAIGDSDVLYCCPGSQDRPMRRGSARQGLRNGAHATAHKPPQPRTPVALPHTMVQKHRRSQACLDRHSCQ